MQKNRGWGLPNFFSQIMKILIRRGWLVYIGLQAPLPPTCSTGAKGATKRGLRAGLRGIRKGYQFFFSQIIKFLIRGVGPTPMVCALGYLNCLPKKPPFLTIFKNFIYWHIQVIFHNGLEKINTNQCFPKNCLFHAISKILNNRPYLWFYFLNL